MGAAVIKSFILVIGVAVILLAAPRQLAADGTLVFRGTMTGIDNSPLPAPVSANWIVHFDVEKIIAGAFIGKTFSFRVHSPSKSGLQVGKEYRVIARWNGTGYSVDEFQWKAAPAKTLRDADAGK